MDWDPSPQTATRPEGPLAPSLGESAGSRVRGWAKAWPPLGPSPPGGPELKGRVWMWVFAWERAGMVGGKGGLCLGNRNAAPTGTG